MTLSPASGGTVAWTATSSVDDPEAGISGTFYIVNIVITNVPNVCSSNPISVIGGYTKSTQQLHLSWETASPITTGTYNFNNVVTVAVDYLATDSKCNQTPYDGTTTGSVTLTSVTATALQGSFDIAFDDVTTTNEVTGTFDAPICSALTVLSSGNYTPDAALTCITP
jgi:hypothetical protein